MMGTVTSQTNTDSSSNPVSEWVLIEWVFLREKIVTVLFFCQAEYECGDGDWPESDRRIT
jgi:FPC/CPF motif-containing protein YcgG